SRVRTMLPGLSQQELAEGVFCDTALEAKLKKKIEQTLAQRKTGVSIERFWHPNLRQAMIILPALLAAPIFPLSRSPRNSNVYHWGRTTDSQARPIGFTITL